jgi:Cytosolic domain of 10TM putative phosphate transporter
MIPMGDNS